MPTAPLNLPPAILHQVKQILHNLLEASPYIRAAAVVRVSGLTVQAVMPPSIEEERVAAMSAVMLMLGERITTATLTGDLDRVYIKGKEGHVVLMAAGGQAVLTVLANNKAQLGMLFVEMQETAQALQAVLS